MTDKETTSIPSEVAKEMVRSPRLMEMALRHVLKGSFSPETSAVILEEASLVISGLRDTLIFCAEKLVEEYPASVRESAVSALGTVEALNSLYNMRHIEEPSSRELIEEEFLALEKVSAVLSDAKKTREEAKNRFNLFASRIGMCDFGDKTDDEVYAHIQWLIDRESKQQ
tara:strand:+ start:822 stop:1331 length:510 start_codon:yes stop_codon:yes gene_type:complete